MQATLFGGSRRSSNQEKEEVSDAPKSKGRNVQLPLGKTREDLIQEREESLKCPICHELKPKYYDICDKENNVTACDECVIKRHAKHGYRWPGYVDLGDSIQFYSQTTGLETKEYSKIVRVMDGLCLNSPLFPQSINVIDEKYGWNCFGITDECAQFLIQKLELVRQDDEEFNKNNGCEQRMWINQKVSQKK
jgi:hypothetical protein